MLRVRMAAPGDAAALLADMRPADMAELVALGDPETLVRRSLETPFAYAAADADGALVACWGWRETSMLGGRALAWCLTTNRLDDHRAAFARASRRWARWLQGRYGLVECWCHEPYEASRRWLAWLGFATVEVMTAESGERFVRLVLQGRVG